MKDKLSSFHDKEITGFLFMENQSCLEVYIKDGEKIIFKNVIFFEFTELSMQNVIFDIFVLSYKDLSEDLLQDFPSLKFFNEQCNLVYFYISSSYGGEVIVVCENEGDLII